MKEKIGKSIVFVSCIVGGFALAAFIVGCSTIMQGTTQGIAITSNPPGALITVDKQTYGKTPAMVKLERKSTHVVKFELAGYDPLVMTIKRSISGWAWGNMVFGGGGLIGGLIGLAVDAHSGGLYKLSPDHLHATLAKEDIGLLYEEDAIYVAIILNPDPSWERVGALSPSR